jgi:hypothetical protein
MHLSLTLVVYMHTGKLPEGALRQMHFLNGQMQYYRIIKILCLMHLYITLLLLHGHLNAT